MTSPKNISGALIQTARIAKDFSLEDLSRRLANRNVEMTSEKLKLVEAQECEVSDILLEEIAACLGVTVTSLLQD